MSDAYLYSVYFTQVVQVTSHYRRYKTMGHSRNSGARRVGTGEG